MDSALNSPGQPATDRTYLPAGVPQGIVVRQERLPDTVEVIAFDIYETVLALRPAFVPAFEGFLDGKDSGMGAAELLWACQRTLIHYMGVLNAVDGPRPPLSPSETSQ